MKKLSGVLMALAMATSGCGSYMPVTEEPSNTVTSEGQNVQAPAGATAAADADALVRVINADPSGQAIEVVASGVTFDEVSYKMITPYLTVPGGEGRFELRRPGDAEPLWVSRRSLLFGQHYSVIALADEDQNLTLEIVADHLGSLEPGFSRVRLINSSDAGDLDLFVANTQTRVLHGVDPQTVTSYADVKAGTLEILRMTRPAPSAFQSLAVAPDRLYTFVVVGTRPNLDVVSIETQLDDFRQRS